jgi:hypothetical protein
MPQPTSRGIHGQSPNHMVTSHAVVVEMMASRALFLAEPQVPETRSVDHSRDRYSDVVADSGLTDLSQFFHVHGRILHFD